jgi:hypothetical protein
MAVDHIRYDILMQEAFRGVVRRVLADAAANGLPGEHHFFITFDTTAAGVEVSARMRAQYPAEMTIVMQHQFWDLTVSEDRFAVGLSFGGIAEKLVVPFAAIKGFADPAAKFEFGLQFSEVEEAAAADPAEATAAPLPAAKDDSPQRPAPAIAAAPSKPDAASAAAAPKPAGKATPAPDDGPDKPSGSGDVVRLDRFRKKK